MNLYDEIMTKPKIVFMSEFEILEMFEAYQKAMGMYSESIENFKAYLKRRTSHKDFHYSKDDCDRYLATRNEAQLVQDYKSLKTVLSIVAVNKRYDVTDLFQVIHLFAASELDYTIIAAWLNSVAPPPENFEWEWSMTETKGIHLISSFELEELKGVHHHD